MGWVAWAVEKAFTGKSSSYDIATTVEIVSSAKNALTVNFIHDNGWGVAGHAPLNGDNINLLTIGTGSRVIPTRTADGKVYNTITDTILMGRTAAHEVGHSLGLEHPWISSSDIESGRYPALKAGQTRPGYSRRGVMDYPPFDSDKANRSELNMLLAAQGIR